MADFSVIHHGLGCNSNTVGKTPIPAQGICWYLGLDALTVLSATGTMTPFSFRGGEGADES